MLGTDLGFPAGVATFAVAVLGAWALEHALTERCLATGPARTEAVVIDKHRSAGRGGPTYALAYRFSDARGSVHEGWQRVDRKRFDGTEVQSSVAVHYCATSPSRHTLDPARLSRERTGLMLATAIALPALLGYVLLLWIRQAIARRRQV